MRVEEGVCACLEWAAASRPLPGQRECGDLHAVFASGEQAVVVLADGLGHGPEAALSARAAVDAVREAIDAEPGRRIERAHQALHRLRGAALGVAVISRDAAEVRWAAVGNVEGLRVPGSPERARRPERFFVQSGLVGQRLGPLRQTTRPLEQGDWLLFVTDGVDERFADALPLASTPGLLARELLRTQALERDDATVVVARYRGWGP